MTTHEPYTHQHGYELCALHNEIPAHCRICGAPYAHANHAGHARPAVKRRCVRCSCVYEMSEHTTDTHCPLCLLGGMP